MPPILASAPINGLRDRHLEYNPATGQLERATLLEAYARNSTSNNDAFGASVIGATVTTGGAGAPDGTATVLKLIENTQTIYHTTRAGFYYPIAGQPQTLAFAAKAGERTKIFVVTKAWNDDGTQTVIDLVSGGIVTPGTGRTVYPPTPMGNGWWRIGISWTYSVANDDHWAIGLVDGSGNTSYLGDGASGAFLWRLSTFENSAVPSSLIQSANNGTGFPNPTPAGTENSYGTGRYPDSPLECDATPLGVPAALTGFIEFIEKGTALVAGAGVWSLGSADNATGARLYVSTGTTGYRVTHHNGTAAVTSEAAAFPAFGDLVRLRWTLGADGSVQIAQSLNNHTETAATVSAANTLAGAWGGSRIYLNGIGIGNVGFIALRRWFVLTGGAHPLADFLALV